MIRLPDVLLPEATLTALSKLQQDVNDQPTYAEQVAEGKRLFAAKSRTAAFTPIRHALAQMCAGPRRCCYCEDSAATDIEHIWPKDYYPHLVFAWENYLYGCPRCNRPKSNLCDIYSQANGHRIKVPKIVKDNGGPPEPGDPVLINPRFEDPMDLMILDLRDTFFFVPSVASETRQWERARHTIDLLKLNEEDVLPSARHEAYESYMARLEKYVDCKLNKKQEKMLLPIISSLKKMGHPTVWREMKRQSPHIPELEELFAAAPEALSL